MKLISRGHSNIGIWSWFGEKRKEVFEKHENDQKKITQKISIISVIGFCILFSSRCHVTRFIHFLGFTWYFVCSCSSLICQVV
ncbi:unnamed protein product [Schistosoma turkestanicum]|nr:unnamed protein product [Schistosoma turkestanicum]